MITVVSQNMLYGGLYNAQGEQEPIERWHGLMDQVRRHEPDILLVQEVGKWTEHNRQAIAQAEQALGLRLVGICASATGGTGLMINPATVKWEQWEDRYSDKLHHPFGVGVLRLPGLDTPLTAISAHLTPYSAATAAQEAQLLIPRAYRYGGLGLIGGDINHFPADDHAIPDPEQIPPYNRSSRWILNEDGTYSPNRIVARTLVAGGLSDAAALVAQQTGDTSVLAATGRGGCRVDQFWVTPPLAPAVVDYQAHDHAFSDHHLILLRLDPTLVDMSLALQKWI